MGAGVVVLFFLAAFFFWNPVIYTWGFRVRLTVLQSNRLATDVEGVSQEVGKRAVVDPRDVVQKALDRAVVEEKVRKIWDQLKLDPPKAVTETDTPGGGKRVTFEKTGEISLKEAFQFMQFYPLLYGEEKKPTEFYVPIGSEDQKFKLTSQTDGTFSLHAVRTDEKTGKEVEIDLSNLQDAVKVLSDAQLKDPLKDTIKDVYPKALDAKLNDQPNFKSALQENDKKGTVSTQERDNAFRAASDVLVGSSVKKNTLAGLSPPDWLQKTNTDIVSKMDAFREELSQEIAAEKETKLKFEITQSMLKTSKEAVDEWEKLKTLDTATGSKTKIVQDETVGKGKSQYRKVKIHETDKISVKEIFKILQFYPDIFSSQGTKQTRFEMPIGGETRKFRLSTSGPRGGKNQIFVHTNDADWDGTTKRGRKGKGGLWAPDYDTMVDEVLSTFPDHDKLVNAMLEAVDQKLVSQPDFSDKLKITGQDTKSADTRRASVEFLVISMVAEAAQPTDELKANFLKQLAKKIREKGRFPEREDIPRLEKLEGKSGRSPAMDEVVDGMLKTIPRKRKRIDEAFSTDEFPVRKKGGTREGRDLIHKQGSETVPSYLIRKRAAGDHDGEVIAAKVAKYCAGTSRRRKRFACSLNDKEESVTVDEGSIKVTEDTVDFDVVDRRNAKEREHIQLRLNSQELATPKLIEDHLSKSKRAGASEAYSKVNKGLAVHGLIFSVLGAVNYFQEGDDLRGAISVAQSAHTLGGLTGLNEIVSKVGKRVLSSAAKGLAKGLNLEKGLERLSTKVERFAERGVGELLGDIPVVGLAFDIYFIEQDIEQLADLNLNDPEDVKLLPLRVIDLALDVSTTILSLVGTFCPEAEVVTEPLVIVLSIIRMAIDDFYIDIMAEMEKVNWKSPWAGLEFLGALVKGFLDGAADFLTGGLRRQMESYRKQEEYDKKLIQDLKNPDNYYKIVGEKEGGGDTIDFTQGRLSSFGGYINFRLDDNNRARLEIGDVTGSHGTIRKTFTVGSNLKDIVLGIGESRTFTYKHETAKLWFVIPIKSYDVICGADLHEKSVYGTYYGNSNNNTFYAVQNPKPTTKPPGKKDEECNFGNLNLKFVTGNYHYNLYGRGGSDTFYLGPEMSAVTGGSGSDLYIIQSDGGKTIIDNFAEDNMRDIIVINVDFDNIQCHQSRTDLDVTYSKSHHIRIKNWFTPGDPTYYRHVSFRSKDGVLFVPKQTLNSEAVHRVQCVAAALDLGAAKSAQTVSLSDSKYTEVKQVSGSNSSDNIVGNDLNNILDGGRGADHLAGGKNEDTYIIRANEGCDVIDNNADDYFNTTDILVFDVPFDSINVQTVGDDLSVSDKNNAQSSCFTITNWTLGYRYRHILFTSADHVVFNVSTSESGSVSKVPIMLDYKTSTTGICVDLSDSPSPDCIKPAGYTNVATVSDSPHDDHIVGNAQTNFLSCSGGEDYLEGGEGTDNYVVKKSCRKATINNFDSRQKVDLLYLDERFVNLRLQKDIKDLKIMSNYATPTVTLRNWFNSSYNRHLGIRTVDGITHRINNETAKLEPYEISKDPTECQCTRAGCDRGLITYNLTEETWKHVVRFQLKSSHCSYKIYGNNLNNYLDPGAGNGYNYQHLEGKNGSDTYVLKYGYGEFNEINNYADDNKTDIIQFGIEFDDIDVYFHGQFDAILQSSTRPSSLSVRILDYFRGSKYQHLQITTEDKVVFNISKQYPYRKIIAVDRRIIDSPQNIDPNTNSIIAAAEDLKGSLTSANNLTGSNTTKEIEGGVQADILRGGQTGTIFEGKHGNDTIYGGAGIDVIFGGDGNDVIYADSGDDYIYGGNGSDIIDGGNGSDTLAFKGDGFLSKGITVDLNIGFGKGVDAEGDIYKSIENVYGTIHDDFLTGSDSDNKLYGLEGEDTLASLGGDDKLVGGEGRDLYLLYKAWGLKIIDNYADDEIEDTLSLAHLNSSDVCVFLVGNDLHLQVDSSNLASVLFHGELLSVIIRNWNVSAKYRHLKVLFKDNLWEDFALSAIAARFDKLGNSVNHIENRTSLQVVFANATDVSLSWQQMNGLLSHPETELFLVHFKQQDPKSLAKTDVDSQTSLSVPSLDPASHYVFALALTKCNATIAVSHTLTTYGRERSCPTAQVPHSAVQYAPPTSTSTPAHGTIASLKCNTGYNIDVHRTEQNTTCLDQEWIPSLPACLKIKQCPVLTKPSNGEVSANGHKEGSKAYYVCHKGFLLTGPKERTCVDEAWDGTVPNCQPLSCPRPPTVDHGSYLPCDYIKHTETYGTAARPLEGYCVKLQCNNLYLPSHVFYGNTYRPRWESDWEIPQGGRVCSDGKWIGYVDDTCEPTVRLATLEDSWNKKKGLLQLWQNGAWNTASSAPAKNILNLSCRSVGIGDPQYVTHSSINSQIWVTCSKLRLTEPKPTIYEGRLEVLTNGNWEGVCVTATGEAARQSASMEICEALGFNYRSAIVSISTGWTDHRLVCSP
ncbi:uncharacterized protein LOC144642570 [Oculina patagonica]